VKKEKGFSSSPKLGGAKKISTGEGKEGEKVKTGEGERREMLPWETCGRKGVNFFGKRTKK